MSAERRLWWLVFALSVVAACVASIIAYKELLPEWLGQHQLDKVVHFLGAATLTFGLDAALGGRGLRRGHPFPPLAGTLLALPIGIEEYMQRYAVFRTSSIWDFTADLAGITVATFASRRWSGPIAKLLVGQTESSSSSAT